MIEEKLSKFVKTAEELSNSKEFGYSLIINVFDEKTTIKFTGDSLLTKLKICLGVLRELEMVFYGGKEMEWYNLKQNKCPACGDELNFESPSNYFTCNSCKFTTSDRRFKEITTDQTKQNHTKGGVRKNRTTQSTLRRNK